MTVICGVQMLKRLYNTCRIVSNETKCKIPYINIEAKTNKEIDNEINKCLNFIERPYYSYLLNTKTTTGNKKLITNDLNNNFNNDFGLP